MDRKGVGAAVAVLALGIASCGGSAPLSRTAFTKRANAICKHRTAGIAAVRLRHRREMAAYMAAALPIASKSIDELAGLKPPPRLQAMYRAFLTGERSQVETVRRALAALRAGRRPGHGETVDALHRQARITRELGLEECV
jgi:hypothetical protein